MSAQHAFPNGRDLLSLRQFHCFGTPGQVDDLRPAGKRPLLVRNTALYSAMDCNELDVQLKLPVPRGTSMRAEAPVCPRLSTATPRARLHHTLARQ